MIGTVVGSYSITELVSVGGMGTVYKAEHTLIGKLAAVKVLHPELRSNREIVQRFFNEAKATTQIKHPGIVEIFDFGYLPSGDGYIVMEFLEGMSLANRLEHDGKMSEGQAAVLMRGVCSALAAAHAKDIVHRDLKPDNIFVCPDPDAPTGERAKILDFGIAKLNDNMTGPKNATKTGAVMGTPTYMSPEQCKGTGTIDARSDLYSIGCMFYELVAGQPPFPNMSAGELIGAHLFVEPATPSSVGAEISTEAEQLVMQLLQKTADKRIQSAMELGRRFAAIANGAGLPSRATPIPTVDYRPTQPSASVSTPVPTPSTPASPHRRSSGPEASAPTLASDSDLAAVMPTKTVSPTTLSGAASQSAAHSAIRPPRSRVGLFAGVAIAGIVGGFAVVMTLNGKPSASSSSSSPSITPASAPAETAPPAPTPAPPAPTPAPVETPAAPIEAPPAPVEPPPAPAEVKVTPAAVQTKTKPPRQKPQTKPSVKPDKGKAGDKGKGSGAGSASGKILIETDI